MARNNLEIGKEYLIITCKGPFHAIVKGFNPSGSFGPIINEGKIGAALEYKSLPAKNYAKVSVVSQKFKQQTLHNQRTRGQHHETNRRNRVSQQPKRWRIRPQQVAVALSSVAAGVVEHGKKGKVTLSFDISQIGESHQVKITHKLDFAQPTKRGQKARRHRHWIHQCTSPPTA